MHMFSRIVTYFLALGATAAASGQQWAASPETTFTGIGALSAVRADGFTTFAHPLFPAYSARIKETAWCDLTVKAYTGYIDVEARHIFFSFFESRSKPDTDDVIFYTSGGPGCSSSMGLLMELGPCRVTNASGAPAFFEHSWTNHANVFFVDQPIGVGYSYAEHGEAVYSTEEAAVDIAAFVAIFFENFPQFSGRRLHMAGHSYGGRYVPLFAAAVYDQNALLVRNGLTPINLESIVLGNGMTDPLAIALSKYDIVCTNASLSPVLPISTCVRMKVAVPRCERMFRASCVELFDDMGCAAAYKFCEDELAMPYIYSGINWYDISKPCTDRGNQCYPVFGEIEGYLSRPDVRALLGADPAVPPAFQICNEDMGRAFDSTNDRMRDATAHVGALLERGVRVLVYAGTYDWGCNWIANKRFVTGMEWSGHELFNKAADRAWMLNGKAAGSTRSAGGLTFVTVDGAGHMVPHDKPEEGLAIINAWLARRPL